MSLYKNPLFIPWIQPVSWLCHEVCWVCRFPGSAALQPGLVWLSSSPPRVVCHQVHEDRIYDVSFLMLANLPARESFVSFEIAIRRSKLTPIQKHAKLDPNSHRFFGQASDTAMSNDPQQCAIGRDFFCAG